MIPFSANLGFLFTEYALLEAIQMAADAGFDAVECHWPYDTPVNNVIHALNIAGIPMLSLNTVAGEPGEFGLSALVGREIEARAAIEKAIEYAARMGAQNIHVMAGISTGQVANECFLENLNYACKTAVQSGITILIEPINTRDVSGYFLQTTEQAITLIDKVDADNIKLMFDCYHVQIMEGGVQDRLQACLPYIGHIQIASLPDRAEPNQGDVDYLDIIHKLKMLGYDGAIGAEYNPNTTTKAGLGWLQEYKVY